MQRFPGVLPDGIAQNRHATRLGIDLEIDEMCAETRRRTLGVDAPVAADRTASLARDLREVSDRHWLDLFRQRAERPHVSILEFDLVRLRLPELGGSRAQFGLDLLR